MALIGSIQALPLAALINGGASLKVTRWRVWLHRSL
jgi:hypothetical protein